MYKIKGKGSNREVYDGATLVGRLVRHEREIINTTQQYRNGQAVSATISVNVEVWWRAFTPEHQRLGRGDPWKGASRSTLKAWADPKAWEGLVTTGDSCVTP